jgi:hypothetical protein
VKGYDERVEAVVHTLLSSNPTLTASTQFLVRKAREIIDVLDEELEHDERTGPRPGDRRHGERDGR